MLVAALSSAAALGVDGKGKLGGAFAGSFTIYARAQVALALVLGAVAFGLLLVRRDRAVAALLGLGGLFAAQLSAVGIVARRRWPHWGGSTNFLTAHELVKALAIAMAIICAAASVVCLVALVRRRCLGTRGSAWALTVALPVGVVVVIALPDLLAGGTSDKRELVAQALMYSLPFGVALAASALMDRFVAVLVAVGVAASAVFATLGEGFVASGPRRDGMSLAILGAFIVAVSRVLSLRRRTAPASRRD